jgi:hypothetical protein
MAYGKQRLAEAGSAAVGFNIPMPPARFSGPYTGRLTIVKMADYVELRKSCSNQIAVACTVRTATTCLVMLGPMVWENEAALAHEMGHCLGWTAAHER